jgi:hypothetical protein
MRPSSTATIPSGMGAAATGTTQDALKTRLAITPF